ncbi:MAG TPA: zinc ribbon domain-containing protein [Candidatus Melainabacteria bacterium]|nr:zinc ribbon domain-containing protein [Candidatus Melainabacteria bacterium]
MSASCPYCGAKLNLGLRFCVVCGRHVTADNLGKYGGLRGGFRPADITRRLDEIISVGRFKKSRQSHDVQRVARWTIINTVYLEVATGLFYSAVVYSLELMFPGKFKDTQLPVESLIGLFNKHKDKIPVVIPPANPPASPPADSGPAADDGKSAVKDAVKQSASAQKSKNTSASSRKKQAKKAKKKSKKKAARRKRRQNY